MRRFSTSGVKTKTSMGRRRQRKEKPEHVLVSNLSVTATKLLQRPQIFFFFYPSAIEKQHCTRLAIVTLQCLSTWKKINNKKQKKPNTNLLDGCQAVLAASLSIGFEKRLLSAGTIGRANADFYTCSFRTSNRRRNYLSSRQSFGQSVGRSVGWLVSDDKSASTAAAAAGANPHFLLCSFLSSSLREQEGGGMGLQEVSVISGAFTAENEM